MILDHYLKEEPMQQQGQHLLKYFSKDQIISTIEKDQTFYGNGKVLLSGEYFVMDGALAIGLPTQVGQSLAVKYSPSFNPKLTWKSLDPSGKLWFEASFEFWHFDLIGDNAPEEAIILQKILRAVRKQNTHFLRDSLDVSVTTQLGFPLDWGLGSSSTLIHNIADWAYISPFKLLFDTFGGSGYDIACAQSDGPIFYQKNIDGPNWSPIEFDPEFKENLFFVHLNKKMNSRTAIDDYNSKKPHSPEIIQALSDISREMTMVKTAKEFCFLMDSHEMLVGKELGYTPVKEQLFNDFQGSIKSLGAWGGDFILACSEKGISYVEEYFNKKGNQIVIPYDELVIKEQNETSSKSKMH